VIFIRDPDLPDAQFQRGAQSKVREDRLGFRITSGDSRLIKSDSFEQEKQTVLSRRRRLIFNNDGGDAVKLPEETLDEPRDFLRIRTTPLKGSHVDTISYCSGIFGASRHNTEVGHLSNTWESTVIYDLIEEGSDPLRVMTEYCRDNGLEMFWSLRMNDTHDASRPERFEENPFKTQNRNCLIGTEENRPRYGGWSAVDYGCEKVREMVLRFVEEVCRNYDVDGIELDFFRHPVFFKETSQGLSVTDDQRGKMTGLMRKIGAMLEQNGRERGKPYIVAARTPDNVDYCATIGLEIERWMEERLIDIYIPSAYIRLSTWEYSVRLGHKYGVKVYAGLSESRVGGGHHADPLRSSDESYRARALNAWDAGADGVYLFNLFDPHRRIWSEMGEPGVLRTLDRGYFASVLGVGRVAGGAYPHQHFISIPTMNPDAPLSIGPDQREAVTIRIAYNAASLPEGQKPETKLCLKMLPETSDLHAVTIVFNGRALRGEQRGQWAEYALAGNDVRTGENTVEVWYRGKRNDFRLADAMVAFDYSGGFLTDESYIENTRRNM
jgi:hypothetical protein